MDLLKFQKALESLLKKKYVLKNSSKSTRKINTIVMENGAFWPTLNPNPVGKIFKPKNQWSVLAHIKPESTKMPKAHLKQINSS